MLHLGKKDPIEERGNPCLIHTAFHWINITILVSLMLRAQLPDQLGYSTKVEESQSRLKSIQTKHMKVPIHRWPDCAASV